MGKVFSRRNFIIGMAAVGSSLALSACNPTASEDPSQEEAPAETTTDPTSKTTDIIVIGSGLAGASCSRAAALEGAQVTLIDKASVFMSTFLTSKGNVSIAQIPENEEYWQFASQTPDTMDRFIDRYKSMTEVGYVDAPYPDYERMQNLMQESCETVSWVEEIGLDFQESFTKEQVGTDTVKPDVSADPDIEAGAQLADAFQAELEALGVEIMLSSEATELIIEDGSVVGATIQTSNGPQEVRGKAVVLATGGFGGSDTYRDELVPSINEVGFQYLGNPMNTGDGMTLGSAVGAALYEDCWVIPNVIMPTKTLTEVDSAFMRLCDHGLEGASTSTKMLVDATGSRFVNEAAPVTKLATSMTDNYRGPYYVLFDSSKEEIVSLLEKGLESEDVIKGESIELLAQASNLSLLEEEFTAYQEATTAGEDKDFEKASDSLISYQEGPYYLAAYVPSFVATMGGVRTNSDCQVVSEEGDSIPGLYAIGEATHRFMYNRSFVRHCSNSSSLTMGRLTGGALGKIV